MRNALGTSLIKCYPSEPVCQMMLDKGGSVVTNVLSLILDSQDALGKQVEELEDRVKLLSELVAQHEFRNTLRMD